MLFLTQKRVEWLKNGKITTNKIIIIEGKENIGIDKTEISLFCVLYAVADGCSYIVVVFEKSDARYDRYNGFLATNSIWDESMRLNWTEHKNARGISLGVWARFDVDDWNCVNIHGILSRSLFNGIFPWSRMNFVEMPSKLLNSSKNSVQTIRFQWNQTETRTLKISTILVWMLWPTPHTNAMSVKALRYTGAVQTIAAANILCVYVLYSFLYGLWVLSEQRVCVKRFFSFYSIYDFRQPPPLSISSMLVCDCLWKHTEIPRTHSHSHSLVPSIRLHTEWFGLFEWRMYNTLLKVVT